MNKVWIYSISFYIVDDEYGHRDWCGTYIEVFPSEESANKFKEDFEDPKNLEYLASGSGTKLDGCYLYYWSYKGDSYESNICEKEILNY